MGLPLDCKKKSRAEELKIKVNKKREVTASDWKSRQVGGRCVVY
jgi:hypothetical protein